MHCNMNNIIKKFKSYIVINNNAVFLNFILFSSELWLVKAEPMEGRYHKCESNSGWKTFYRSSLSALSLALFISFSSSLSIYLCLSNILSLPFISLFVFLSLYLYIFRTSLYYSFLSSSPTPPSPSCIPSFFPSFL
jgi:hypothetical protein